MAEVGVVTLVEQRAAGSPLTVAAAAGATSLTVDYAGDFDDAGGTLSINGATLAFSGVVDGATQTDPDVVTLTDPLPAAASVDDWVQPVQGGVPAVDYIAHVSLDDIGDTIEVTIPFEQRLMWPLGPQDPPIPVTVSDDCTKLESVPARDGALIVGPPDAAHLELDSGGMRVVDDSGLTTVDLNVSGDITLLGELGTAPPDQVGMFMYSTKFSRAGAQQTNLVFQFNTGANSTQPSIQAWTTDASNMRLYSGRDNTAQREATLQLDNGGILLGIEYDPLGQNYDTGSRLQIDNDGFLLTSRSRRSFSNTMGPWVDGAYFGGTMTVALRNVDGTAHHGIQFMDGGNVRVLTKNNMDVTSSDGTAYRSITCLSVTQTSDRALKTNLAAPPVSGLTTMRQAPVYTYRMADDPSGPMTLGVMAEDVPALLKRRLGIDESKYGLDIYGYVAAIALAVQELDVEMDQFRTTKPARKARTL